MATPFARLRERMDPERRARLDADVARALANLNQPRKYQDRSKYAPAECRAKGNR